MFDNAAAVHHDTLDIAWYLGVQRHAEERLKLARQLDVPRDCFGDHRRELDFLRPQRRRDQTRQYGDRFNALHNIGSRGPPD